MQKRGGETQGLGTAGPPQPVPPPPPQFPESLQDLLLSGLDFAEGQAAVRQSRRGRFRAGKPLPAPGL